MIFIDFETRSNIDLSKCGAYRYAMDASTRPILLAYRLSESDDTHVWEDGDALPDDLIDAINSGEMVAAWNVQFDRWVWNCSQFGARAVIKVSQSYDVMSQAAVMGLPLSLAKCGDVIGLSEEVAKDKRGTALIRKFCGSSETAHTGTDWSMFKAYAARDVDVLVLMHRTLDKLTDSELANLHTDMYVNERGLPIDMDGVNAGLIRAADLNDAARDEFAVLTSGLSPTQTTAFVRWVRDAGVPCTSVAKAHVAKMLESSTLPPAVRRALEIRRDIAKSSVAKLAKMQECQVNGRVHGCHQHHAATTGRAGGRLVQTQNLPRPEIEQSEIEEHIANGFENATMSDISSCIRGLISSGVGFVCSDWSNIEGRVGPWLAGEQWKLDAFREFDSGHGDDIYKIAAGKVYHCSPEEVTKDQRQVGKTIELACLFGGGVGAFESMGAIFGVSVPEQEAQSAITAWRTAHPNITKIWALLDSKARLCAKYGVDMPVNDKLGFTKRGSHMYLRLPSGRELCYPYADVRSVETRFGKRPAIVFEGKDTYTQRWGTCQTFGGKLFENCVQAVARDVLYATLRKLVIMGHVPVMHVHDEAVVESSTLTLDELNAHMCDAPDWAEGLPLAAEGWTGERYRK